MNFEQRNRPTSLRDVMFKSAAVEQTLEDYAKNKINKHLLLYGPKGTGKSVTAQIVLNARVGDTAFNDPFHANSYEADSDSFQKVMNSWQMQTLLGAHTGCVIFDELDQFSMPMQKRFRAFIDEHQGGIVIATTNNLHLIDAPLKDRFRCLHVDYPSSEQWAYRVMNIFNAEGFTVTHEQACVLLQGFDQSGRNLNDWVEDYILKLKSAAVSLVTNQQSAQPSATKPSLTAQAVAGTIKKVIK
ncbi:ATP-binding protein [Sulfitobacter guttiformis]|uniref:ATPase family protein associated with various cellular activities (AAA) n=1 Tax=Sulfitobacter guttiformis TaxID=74349 RepID=A0A420DUG0_9RHOB|nr:ATP-binding protein [Sulfitobacter guttiformis]KIN71450.1 Replication factor C small subunit [Sulfitobacter guttiformis KCTC 32187]RKE97892.1 ATPase family protein associated with various cellular activities (AAA) [Sulfitobacter guttiformis]